MFTPPNPDRPSRLLSVSSVVVIPFSDMTTVAAIVIATTVTQVTWWRPFDTAFYGCAHRKEINDVKLINNYVQFRGCRQGQFQVI